MNKFLFAAVFACGLSSSAIAMADYEQDSFLVEKPATPPPAADPKPVRVPLKAGMTFDLSVPSGVALGAEVRAPAVPWLKFGLAITGTLAPGVRTNVLFDPINFPIAPLLNVDLGHQFPFSIPGVSSSPSISFSYVDLQGGLGLGKRDGFRFMLMGGMSYLTGKAANFSGLVHTSGLTIADPSFNGWVPNAKLGFGLLF